MHIAAPVIYAKHRFKSTVRFKIHWKCTSTVSVFLGNLECHYHLHGKTE